MPGGTLAGAWWSALVDYWFRELTRAQWFSKVDAVDRALKERFGSLPQAVQAAKFDVAQISPQACLGAVLALDQVPRNVFRGRPEAFAYDEEARRLTQCAITHGHDRGLTINERAFLYLPLEHSEDLDDQEQCVDLMSSLGDAEYTRYAIAHRMIIARFGRFPHRNAILRRTSTPEEIAFLSEPGSSF